MESASNALFDELMYLWKNDSQHLCNIIDRRCNRKVSEVLQTEEERLGGMPMSGIMWDNVAHLIDLEQAKAEQKKERVRQFLLGRAQKCFEWWVMPGPGGKSRLEMSLEVA